MIIDGALVFTGTPGIPGSVDSPTASGVSTNIIDLVNMRDLGIGDDPALKLLIQVITAFAGGTSVDVQLQGAPDNAGVPGTWTTMWDSTAIALVNLTAGLYISNVDLPRIFGPTPLQPFIQPLPRFLRLNYVLVGVFTGGSLYGAIVLDREDVISYRPGVVINN
jgi:hypothetical protein